MRAASTAAGTSGPSLLASTLLASGPLKRLASVCRTATFPSPYGAAWSLSKSKPQANKRWTDSGEAHDDRGLKHRAQDEGRPVPIPPELVTILREHIDEFGVQDDGHLFRTSRGGVISIGTYCEAWQKARMLALTPEQVVSPLAARPYDLRHAAVSLWFNAGVRCQR